MSRRNKLLGDIDVSKYTSVVDNIVENETDGDKVITLPLSDIADMEGNEILFPYDEQVIARIADEIKTNGFHAPIIVAKNADGSYTCISGHQRKRAMQLLGKAEIPCIVLTDLTEQAKRDLWRAENALHRESTPLSRARLVQSYCEDYEKYGMGGGKRKYAAGKAGVSEGQVSNLLVILSMPEEIQELCKNVKFPYSALHDAWDFDEEKKDLLVVKLQQYAASHEDAIPASAELKRMIAKIKQDTAESEFDDNTALAGYDPLSSQDVKALEKQREKEFKAYYKKNFVTDPKKASVVDENLQKATDQIYSLLNGGMFIAGNRALVEQSLYGLEKAVSMLKKNLKRTQ